jgi:hypothetical protein
MRSTRDASHGTVPGVSRSPDTERYFAEAGEALALGDVGKATGAAWRSASSAAQTGDADSLASLVDFVATLEERATGGQRDEAAQLRVYVEACLEDARSAKRPPSAFERLLGRDRRLNR